MSTQKFVRALLIKPKPGGGEGADPFLSTEGWRKQLRYIHSKEYFSAVEGTKC
jgi:hypothetical protein